MYTFVALNVQNRDIYNGFNGDLFVNYCRQRQIFDSAEWVQRKKLPARTLKHPYLYMLCAENEESFIIGLWDLWEDEIEHLEIELDAPPKEIRFYRTEGDLDGNTVRLTKSLAPYDCAFIEIKK